MASGFLGSVSSGTSITVQFNSLTKLVVSPSSGSSAQVSLNGVNCLFFNSASGTPPQQITYVAPGTHTIAAVNQTFCFCCIEES
jgi:hypothetical protein